MMSTLVFVDPESSTQADGAQSSRVPPFEDLIDTETLELPLTIAPPTSLSESTLPVLGSYSPQDCTYGFRARSTHALGLSANMAEVAAMSESAFRVTLSYVEDSEKDDDEKDEEIEESLDSDSVSEDAEDEGPTAKDKDPATGDEGLVARVEGPGMDYKSYGIDDESRGLDDEGHSIESDSLSLEEEEEAIPEGQLQAAPVVGTVVSAPLGLGYEALRHRELALEEDHAGQTDAQRASLWHAISDVQGENQDLRLQLAEERRA
ncbi:hypothetical protein Tco_0665440 [Tanacetum coccineum]